MVTSKASIAPQSPGTAAGIRFLPVNCRRPHGPRPAQFVPPMTPRRIIVGISGASGIVYGVRVLEALRAAGVETHLVMTRSAQVTLGYELPLKVAAVQALASVHHRIDDIGASIASG